MRHADQCHPVLLKDRHQGLHVSNVPGQPIEVQRAVDGFFVTTRDASGATVTTHLTVALTKRLLKTADWAIIIVYLAFTAAIGMNFTAPPAGLINRSARYAMMVEDGVVKVLHHEESPGTCEISGGESLLEAI